jgi:hypothetical protein
MGWYRARVRTLAAPDPNVHTGAFAASTSPLNSGRGAFLTFVRRHCVIAMTSHSAGWRLSSRAPNRDVGCSISQIWTRTRRWRQKGGNWRHRQNAIRTTFCSRWLETGMSFRDLGERRLLSQERLAELSGLSLRTIQHVEAGHRVGALNGSTQHLA